MREATIPTQSKARTLPAKKSAVSRPRRRNQADEVERVVEFLTKGRTSPGGSKIKNPIEDSSVVFTCIDARAQAIASTPPKLWRGQEEIESHPILDRLNEPNKL